MSPRNALTNDQKRSICLYKLNNPLIKDKKIGKHFSKIFNVEKIPKSSLSRILSESETYLYNYDSKNKFRIRPADHPEMEDCLHMWYCDKRSHHIPVSDDLEHFLAIKNKMDSIRRALAVQTSLDNYLIK